MNFFKHNWFGIFAALLILSGFALFLIVLFSPRQDNQNRGFIPCTEEMAVKLLDCDKQIMCTLQAILNNSLCDAKVIGKGFSLWLKGEQNTPWANYFFEPDLETSAELPQEVEEFYKENPNLHQDMLRLQKMHEELQAHQPSDQEEVMPKAPAQKENTQEDKDDTKK